MADNNEHDWLEGNNEDVKQQQRRLAIEFARKYEVFLTDPRAKDILAHWDKTLARAVVPTESSLQAYAAHNAVREFISKIHSQIELAQERD